MPGLVDVSETVRFSTVQCGIDMLLAVITEPTVVASLACDFTIASVGEDIGDVHEAAEIVMDALMDLQESNLDLVDCATGSDASTNTITVMMTLHGKVSDLYERFIFLVGQAMTEKVCRVSDYSGVRVVENVVDAISADQGLVSVQSF